ncbi:putative ribonuclease H-like domain-containing protein [Tanacetum coccineum]
MVKPVWNNAQRVNHQNFAKKTHPCAKKNLVPRAVLMKSGLVSVNTARQVNTAHSKTTVNAARPMSYLSKIAHSTVKRPIHKNTAFKNSNIDQRVNTVSGKKINTARPKAVVNAVKGNNVNAVKASACWVWKPKTKVLDHGNPQMDLQDQGVIDNGCLRQMTRNMSYLTDYEEIDGGYVAFVGNPKGGKITRKVNTAEGVNVASEEVSTAELLIDESQILLRVPRKNNMYSVDLKNIVPKGGLTCLFTKATSDESKLWHRRLGHLNFKTMNKLVKGNLVRGLPSKLFENDQTCVACQKGKQHRASCKSKTENSISLPLHLLHMDLFGPTFVKSLMKKMYCLVVTNDYSRFTWVFFLATKDETSGILKSFITGIENLVDHKVKVIRCDNGTEFKNREMNQFCEMKGILRQFSVARTPQQNGVAKRRNRILIEAARTMLADSKLPTTFWAEAVNTACYVQNRVLVVKPHNKTPYELFHGRTPTLSFMRPFRCPVTILNTIDHLGKFDGKADEGFFVGYSLNSKAFRVFNSRTRIVEENLHIRFSESTPNAVGSGPDWLFDIDALTRTMNYEPIVAGTQSNGFAGTKASDNAGQARKETTPVKDYILLPLWTVDPPFSQNSKSSQDDGSKPPSDDGNKVDEDPRKDSEINDVGGKISIELLVDSNMPTLEDYSLFDFTRDDEDDGVEANMNNLDTTIQIEEEVYVCQPQGFEDPNFPDRVYKVEKALYGLHQAHRAWYETLSTYMLDNGFQKEKINKTLFIKRHKGDILLVQVYVDDIIFGSTKKELCNAFQNQDKYVVEILKKFGFTEVKTASTPMETQKPLLKDEDGEEVDVLMYRSMIGSLMYLTSSRPDIMFAVCQPKLGLWYPKDSPFDLVTYTNSDYAGASLDRKSITGGKAKKSVKLMMEKLFGMELELMLLNALVDGKKVIISEASVRRDLKLEDEEGIDCLPNSTIFEQLALMGYEKVSQKLTFYKPFFCPQWKFLIHTILQCLSTKTTAWNEFSSTMASAIICLATNQKFNFSKYIFESMVRNLDNLSGNFLMYPRKPKRKDTEIPQPSDPIENVADEAIHKELGDSLGRIDAIDVDEEITLVSVQNVDEEMFDVNVLDGEKVFVTELEVVVKEVNDEVNVVEEVVEVINSAKLIIDAAQVSATGDIVSTAGAATTVSVATTTTADEITLAQDKGKGILIEPVKPMKKKDLIRLDEETAKKLQAEFDEEERLAREKAEKEKEANIALIETWDDIQANIDVDHQLAERL